MKNVNTYNVRLPETYGIFDDTLKVYQGAVLFFVDVIYKEWGVFCECKNSKDAQGVCEHLTVYSEKHPYPKYNFRKRFYKFPSYLRRAAITEAYGIVSSYKSNLRNWEEAPKGKRGKCPQLPKKINTFPCMYKGNCFTRTGLYTARIKVLKTVVLWQELFIRSIRTRIATAPPSASGSLA